jgi:hypothetical protein
MSIISDSSIIDPNISDTHYTSLFSTIAINARNAVLTTSAPPSVTARINSSTALAFYVYGYCYAMGIFIPPNITDQINSITDTHYTSLFSTTAITARNASTASAPPPLIAKINSSTALTFYVYGYNYGLSKLPAPSTGAPGACPATSYSYCSTSGGIDTVYGISSCSASQSLRTRLGSTGYTYVDCGSSPTPGQCVSITSFPTVKCKNNDLITGYCP